MLELKPLDCRTKWYGGMLLCQTDGSQLKFAAAASFGVCRQGAQISNDWYKKVSRRFTNAYSCNQLKFSSITDV